MNVNKFMMPPPPRKNPEYNPGFTSLIFTHCTFQIGQVDLSHFDMFAKINLPAKTFETFKGTYYSISPKFKTDEIFRRT